MVQVGDKVRLEVEGTVLHVRKHLATQKPLITFKTAEGDAFEVEDKHLTLLEDLRVGDVVLDADGYYYRLRTINSDGDRLWDEMGSGDTEGDIFVARPLVLLARDGVKA